MDDAASDELARVAHDWDRAMVANDADAIGLFMADDWTIVGPDGSVGGKEAFVALIRSGALTHDVMTTEDMTVRVYGSTAVLIARGLQWCIRRAYVPGGRAIVKRVRERCRCPLALRAHAPVDHQYRVQRVSGVGSLGVCRDEWQTQVMSRGEDAT